MNIENLTATENISGSWAAFINFTFNTVTVNTIAEESRNDDTRLRIIQLYVQPIVGISGMVANILTFAMLIKSGLKKPSNIIIFGLTLADCFLLISSINVVELTARFLHSKETANYFGWECSENLARFLFILNRVLTTLHYWGGFAGTSLPVIITVERFIAVFFPIKFASIVTSKRAFLVVVSVWLFWGPWVCFSAFLRDFRFTVLPNGQFIGYEKNSDFFIRNAVLIINLNRYVFNFLSSIVPVSIVTFGCILIGVRVKYSYLQRQLISSAKKTKRPSLKTTRTLVAIALIFATIHGTYFIMTCAMVDQYLNHTTFSVVFDEIKLILVYVCGSCNFFVYVLINNKFRNILMNIFCKR
ncbi:G-protein coupled receptor [Biomphalaria glabrata]|nr:putative G-protein coupled receptor [Biomphalaria glabrata]